MCVRVFFWTFVFSSVSFLRNYATFAFGKGVSRELFVSVSVTFLKLVNLFSVNVGGMERM